MSTVDRSTGHQILALVGWVVATNAVGLIGAIASRNAGQFYSGLNRPSFAPPGWIFAPVWTLLYVLMGVAAWRVWRVDADHHAAWTLFGLQLLANAAWTWIFFGVQSGRWAFVEILALWVLIVATVRAFAIIDLAAGVLLLPYLAWVSFATILTWTIWRANPTALG